MSTYYPIFLDLTRRRCLVVGGGPVAERKVQGLLETKAHVVVVSPSLTNVLSTLAVNSVLTHISRPFHENDVMDSALVIAATE